MTFADALTIISAVVPLLVPVGIWLLRFLSEKLPMAQRDMLHLLAGDVVYGIEQGMKGQDGATKKAEAVTALETITKHFGVRVDPKLLDILIETAVGAMNASKAEPQEAPNPPDMPANVLGFNPPAPAEVPALRRVA